MWTLFYNNTGNQNTAAGAYVLFSNTEGNSNTAAGFGALSNNTTGNNNTADGAYALQYNTEGNNNVANGAYALNSNTTGSNNVALGYQAGFNETGSDKLYIENSSSDTPLIYGDFAADSLVINGQLYVDGDARVRNLEGEGFRQVFADSQGKLMVNSVEVLASQSNAPGTPILDYNCPQGASDTIHVSGFPESVQSENICVTINLTHTFMSDLEIFLIAPNGDILNLMRGNGGGGDNLVNTKFCDNFAEPLYTSQAPFTGTFLPFGSYWGSCIYANVYSFSAIGGGTINPNGMWILKVFDIYGGDQGVLNNWSVELTSGGLVVDVGTNNYLPKWDNGTLTKTSSIYDNGNVGIGTADPENSAALDVNSSNKGFLPPRLTYPQRLAIESPAEGLMIYNLDTKTINYFDGTQWKNMNGTPDPWGIGSFYQGGRIAYIYQPGDPGYIEGQPTGLIAQTNDITPGVPWGCYGTTMGAWYTGLGAGAQNTNNIVAGCADVNTAARYCLTATTYANGYDDWYLPSKEELNKLNINKVAIGQFVEAGYWSSTESNSEKAWGQSFYNSNNGYQVALDKYDSYRVRAVRTFYHSNTVQERLDRGQTPLSIYNSGIPLDSLYGKSYQGGIIAYLNTTTGAGFVAAPSNQSTGTVWGCDGTDIPGADGMAIGTGAQNTIDIEAGCTEAGIAADICANLALNNYSDWFLPSMEELNVLYVNLDQKGFGAFTNNLYWSSSEYEAGVARLQNFTDGGWGIAVKYEVGHVRAIRNF
jgi:subtilisin-like proprotein convertase family protein